LASSLLSGFSSTQFIIGEEDPLVMRKFALLFALPIALWASTASAAIITYTSSSAWQTAVGTWFTEPFNNSGLQSFTGVVTDAGAINSNQWLDRVTPGSGGDITTFRYLPGTLLGAGGTWDTDPNGEGTGIKITLNLTGGGTQTVSTIGPIDGFFGWTSTLAFDSFTLAAGNHSGSAETFELDNLKFAPTPAPPPVPTPEPGTLALVGTGLFGLGATMRRKWMAKR
jgi:hypothetical protein